MDLYLLKFSACLFVLCMVYWLLLEKQDMHRFKRFYLLGSVVIALIIPLLSITTYVEPVAITPEVLPAYLPSQPIVMDSPTDVTTTVDVWSVLRIVYGIGILIFLLRFVLNLGQLYRRILNNKTQKVDTFIYVLLKNYRIPHSFFKYIFLNQQRFEDQAIPKEVLLHEQTHARQLHSIDIILLELLQIVFWFHPLVYILKHHIKLNHEFLADEAVLNQGTDAKNYQNVLLQFSSSTQHHLLASAINYSSFKKRFTVMKTQTSNTRKWLSSLLLIPVIAILFYSFAEHKEVVKSSEATNTNDFLVTVEKNDNTLELRCESGCNWSQITLEPRNTPYIINDYGFTDGSSIDSDKFAFSIQPTDIGVALDGLAGTAWIDLKFSLGNNKKQAINQMGMTKISADGEYRTQNRENLQQRAIRNYYTKLFFTIEDDEGNYIKKRFYELSYEDKIKWVYAGNIPYDRIDVTESHFEDIKSSDNLIVKIDGNYVSVDNLKTYKATDFITFNYLKISELAGMEEASVVNLVTHMAYDAYVNIMSNQYAETLKDYENELLLPENERTKDTRELVSIFEFLDYNFNQFSEEIIVKNNFTSPTPIPMDIINAVHQSYLAKPTLYINIHNDLYLNGSSTSLETIGRDFNEITNFQPAELNLEADGRKVENSLLNKIMLAIGKNLKNITVSNGQATIYDPDFISEGSIDSDGIKAYLKKYEVYKKLQDTPPHYIKKSKSDQEKMDKLFSELGGMYFRMSKASKAKVNRPVAPVNPYVKITLKGKTYYKEFKDLTEEEKATLPPPPPPAKSSEIIQKPLLWIMVNKKGELLVGDEIAKVSELEEKLRRLSKSDNANRLISIQYDKETSKKLIKELEILITKYKFKVFSIDAAKIPPPPPPPPAVKKSKGGPNANDIQNAVYNPTFLEYVVEMEELGASFYLDEKPITANEARAIAKNNKGKRTDMLTQKDANGKFVVKLSSPQDNTIQKGATKEQLSKYNAWAKKINAAMKKAMENEDVNAYPIVKMKEFEHYKYIFDFVMTEAQRKQAEPFPDKMPPPPPRPKTPKYKETRLKQPKSPASPKPVKIEVVEVPEKALTPNEKARLAKKTKEYLEKHPEKIKKQKAKKGGSLEEIEVPLSEIEEVPPPPPPPAPEEPLELLKRMAKTNAKFFYDEKVISSEKAIELLKRNSDLNVRAHKTNSKQPLIYISKKPIVVEVKNKSKN